MTASRHQGRPLRPAGSAAWTTCGAVIGVGDYRERCKKSITACKVGDKRARQRAAAIRAGAATAPVEPRTTSSGSKSSSSLETGTPPTWVSS